MRKGSKIWEYSISYVWLSVIGAFLILSFYTYIDTPCVKSAEGFGGTGLEVTNFGVSNNTELQMVIRNNYGHETTIEKIEVESTDKVTKDEETTLDPLESTRVDLSGFSNSDKCNQLRVRMSYQGQTSLDNPVETGSLKGNLEIS